jgi:putative tryptophan/tyrosine transport system substrate-binding protein
MSVMQFDQLKRRDVIALLGGAAAAWPLAARAQQGERTRRIGVLMVTAEGDPDTRARLAALRQGLERRGWSEGRNLNVDYRFTAARSERIPALAKELVGLQPDVMLGHSAAAAAGLQRESRTIPTVFVNVSDPIGAGFIASMARPGGNLTGVLHLEAGIIGKWFAMLREIEPRLARAAFVANPKTTQHDYFLQAAKAAASSLAIELVSSPVGDAVDIERAIESFARVPNGGFVMPPDATTITHRDLVIALAARHRLPAVYALKPFVAAGGLMSYGTDQNEMFRLAASYVDRILRGDKPADLPVQAPTKFETAVNLRTAKALGLTVPPGLLVAADEVIE